MTNVATKSQAAQAMEADVSLCAALMGGTRAMRTAGATYLPKWPNEEQSAFDERLKVATLFPAYQRTVQTLTGKPFSKPLTYSEDMPEQLLQWAQDDVDLQGRKLDIFAADVMQEALALGMSGILVDFPTAEGVKTAAQEQAAGLRPYMIQIHPMQIVGWKASRISGRWLFTQLRIMESVEEDDGAFAQKVVEQVRVLEPGKWQLWRKVKTTTGKDWAIHAEGVTTLNYIPFVPVYGERMGFMQSKPPMVEMAHLNVEHWQSSSDQQTITHVARVPILTVIGVDDDKWNLTVGASNAVKLPMGASMAYVEHSGAAIGAGKESLKDLEDRMRQAGAELLVLSPSAQATATEIATDNAVGMCALQRIVQGVEDALDLALQYMADWINLPDGGSVTIFTDFAAATLADASAQLLLTTNQAGKLSDETLHAEFQRRGIVSADVDWLDEKDRIDSQGPAMGAMGDTFAGGPDLPSVAPIAPTEPAEPAFDMGAFADAMKAAMASIPAPVVNVPAPVVNIPAPIINMPPITMTAPAITVESPQITVNTPEQPPANVTVNQAPITVNTPEQLPANVTVNPPNITVQPPSVTVHPPNVQVTVEKGGEVKFTSDAAGNITGASLT